MTRTPTLLALMLAWPLPGCIESSSGPPPLVVNVQQDGDRCYVAVNGAQITSERLLEAARAQRGRRGIVVFDRGAPYKCVGAAVIVLQQGGMAKIDLAPWQGR